MMLSGIFEYSQESVDCKNVVLKVSIFVDFQNCFGVKREIDPKADNMYGTNLNMFSEILHVMFTNLVYLKQK